MSMKAFVFIFISGILVAQTKVSAQDSLSMHEGIAVLARASRDSISLRWAPFLFSTWEAGNSLGYTIERYTIVRNGFLLDTPERLTLTNVPLKPFPEEAW